MSIVDDELITRLRSALDTVTIDVAPDPPRLDSLIGLTEEFPSPRRNQRRLLVLAAAAVAVVAAIAGVLVLVRDHHDSVVGTPDSANTVPPVITSVVAPAAVHPVPPTPDGWELLEWGNVRLALPPDLSPFHVGNGCEHTMTDAALRVTCGNRWVEIHAGVFNGAAPVDLINALQVVPSTGGGCTGCHSVSISALDATVNLDVGDDSLGGAILGTIGPSGSWRFANEPRPAPPADWKTVAFDHVTIRVPADWAVESTPDDATSTCPRELRDRVVQLDHGTVVDCGPVDELRPLADGVRLYRAEPPLSIGTGRAEQVITSQNDGTPTIVLEVGYGADPTVALAILNSMESQPAVDGSTPYSSADLRVDVPVVAFGESVMLGAAPELTARGVKTIAEVSKGPSWMLDQLQQAKASYNITYGVVLQLGTNGPVTRNEYESLLAEVSPAIKRVVVLTLTGDRPWTAANNEIIRSLPATHPNVVVLDWEKASAQITDHLSSDGIHLRDETAKTYFVDEVLKALGLPT